MPTEHQPDLEVRSAAGAPEPSACLRFAQTAEQVAATPKRLEKAAILSTAPQK